MKTGINTHILSLLKEHECVVLPSIGAFVLKKIPTHISAGQIFAASKTITFNKYIVENDQLLISILSSKENISYTEAQTEIDSFINKIKFELSQKHFFDIDNIGRLISNDGSITFTSNSKSNSLDKVNFGLESLSLFPIQREVILEKRETIQVSLVKKEIENKVASEFIKKPINNVRKLKKSSLIGLAATFLLMFSIASLMFTNTSFDQLKVQNANILDFLVPSNSNIETRHHLPKEFEQEQKTKKKKKGKRNKEENNIETAIVEEAVTETIAPVEEEAIVDKVERPDILSVVSENPKGYYVVIGAFSNINNANKAKYECSLDNSCHIFKTENGLYRVAIFTSPDIELALDFIAEKKKTNSSYWLMENKQ